MKRLTCLLAAAAVALPVAAVAADDAFVAVVYSNSTGNVAFAQGDSDMAVRDKAMSECQKSGAGDCQLGFAGTDMCVALARSADEKSFGIGAGSSKERAQTKAVSECSTDGAVGCNLHDTYCGPASLN